MRTKFKPLRIVQKTKQIIITESNSHCPTSSQMNYQTLDRDYLIKQNRKLKMQLNQSNNLKQLHQQALMQINQLYPQSQVIKTLIQIISQTSNKTKLNQLNDIIMQLQGQVMVLQKIATQTQQNENIIVPETALRKHKDLGPTAQILRENRVSRLYLGFGNQVQVDHLHHITSNGVQEITITVIGCAEYPAVDHQEDFVIKRQTYEDQYCKHMKQQVQRKKDEVRNMTMMLFCQGEGQEVDTGNVLDELNNGQGYSNNNGNTLSNENIDQLYVPSSERSNLSMNRFSKLNISKLNTSIANNNPNTTLNFIKMQRQLLKDVKQQDQMKSSITNQSDMDCPELSILFPDKVQKIIKTKQQAKVPYLNMKKVRQMMAKREQKMRKQIQQQKHHVNPTTKIIQLQTQLQITRKQLSSQTLKFRIMSQELKSIRLKIDQLEKRNQLLVESNFKLKNNYHNIYKDYQVCKAISSEVERALGLIVGQDNQQKVREKLGALLGTFTQIKPSAQNQLQETVRDQFKAQRLLQIFDSKNTFRSEKKRNHSV